MRKQIIDLVFSIAKDVDAFDKLENKLKIFNEEKLSDNLIDCGIMPEVFDHDSSEEKMWAKYSDILLSKFFNFVGYESEVLGTRGNSADVFAKNSNHSIVGDAKTFRLSRTAKNQKDFKVQALDSWRENNNFSILASPLIQYPTKASQIYEQAIKKNVALISYTHLKFILDNLDNLKDKKVELKRVFNIGNELKSELSKKDYKKSNFYWEKMDLLVSECVDKKVTDLQIAKDYAISKTKELGKEGITYWKNKILEYKNLPKDKAIELLIKAYKIEQKIETIEKTIKRFG